MLVSRSHVFATNEFNTLRLNDMFVLHAGKPMEDPHPRFLVSGSLLYHSMLLAGQIPRGGLGFGPIYRAGDLLIGNGFIDGYEAADKRTARAKDICAVQLSPAFFAQLPDNRRTYQLLCFFEGYFYIHPWFLTDPEMGEFTAASILDHLERPAPMRRSWMRRVASLWGLKTMRRRRRRDRQRVSCGRRLVFRGARPIRGMTPPTAARVQGVAKRLSISIPGAVFSTSPM